MCIFKGKQTVYNFGERAAVNGWFKVKPDYGPKTIIDLVVVGARYEDNTYEKIRSFEIATLASESKQTNFLDIVLKMSNIINQIIIIIARRNRYRIIGGVQARLKEHDFKRLVRALNLRKGNTVRPQWIEGILLIVAAFLIILDL